MTRRAAADRVWALAEELAGALPAAAAMLRVVASAIPIGADERLGEELLPWAAAEVTRRTVAAWSRRN